MIESLIAWLSTRLNWGDHEHEVVGTPVPPHTPPPPPVPAPTPVLAPKTRHELFYAHCKGLLGQHLTLDPAVPKEVGCGEAVSKALKSFGVKGIPTKGLAGTGILLDFLRTSKEFKEVAAYEVGAVIMSATGTGNGTVRGHTGVCGNTQIMSNNSATGTWDTQWVRSDWDAYYHKKGGIPTRYFRII